MLEVENKYSNINNWINSFDSKSLMNADSYSVITMCFDKWLAQKLENSIKTEKSDHSKTCELGISYSY